MTFVHFIHSCEDGLIYNEIKGWLDWIMESLQRVKRACNGEPQSNIIIT